MLKKFFDTYKIYILLGLAAVYSAGLWHVSSTYAKANCLKESLERVETTLENNGKNQVTKDEIAKITAEALAKWRPANQASNRKIENEIAKDPVYRDCKSNPDVVREYQGKLDSQPE